MNTKTINSAALGLIFSIATIAALPATSFAAPISFVQTLYPGQSNLAVTELQRFLFDEGYTKSVPTGTFSASTKAALISFQRDMEVDQTGDFDPSTMAVANARLQSNELALVEQTHSPSAHIAVQSVTHKSSLMASIAAAFGYDTTPRTIAWTTSSYPAGAHVDISLIRKTSNSPVSYSFVRSIARNVPNTGTYAWTPASSDTGADFFVQVGCSNDARTLALAAAGCAISSDPISVK